MPKEPPIPPRRQDKVPPDSSLDKRITRSLLRLAQHPSALLTQKAFETVVELERELDTKGANDLAQQDVDLRNFLQASLFYRRRNPISGPKGRVAGPPDPHEFHSYVSMFGNYPQLLRRLGLVVDFEVPVSGISLAKAGTCQLVAPAVTGSVVLQTAYTFQEQHSAFFAESKDHNYISSGQLKLSNHDYFSLHCLEILDAAMKTMALNESVERYKTHGTADTPSTSGIPSARTGGFSVTQNRRALQLAQHLAKSRKQHGNVRRGAAPGEPLYAEDLMRGLRIDVWDTSSTTWHSLCKRKVNYRVPNCSIPADVDEGVVTMSLSRPTNGSDNQKFDDDQYLHESLFRWDGWSLSVPRPGKGIGAPKFVKGTPPQSLFDISIDLPTDQNGKIVGSLPSLRLRSDLGYRFRARVVDLAGNSLQLDDPLLDDSLAIPGERDSAGSYIAETYCRYEPVGAPVTSLIDHLDPAESRGEQIDRLVIRTSEEQTTDTCQRVLIPPQTSAAMAEACCAFDKSLKGKPTLRVKEAYDWMKDRDEPLCSDSDADDASNPHHSNNPIVCDADLAAFSLPYLPDPLSKGLAITFHEYSGRQYSTAELFKDRPRGDNPFTFFPDDIHWPDISPIVLQIKDGTGLPRCSWNGQEKVRVLEIDLPKAEIMKLMISSNLSVPADEDDHLQKMGIWKWVEKQRIADGRPIEPLRKLAAVGLHWMLTPQHELILVHAVKKPLSAPEFSSHLWATRELGKTYATLVDFPLRVHGKSTDKVDLWATWKEEADDPALTTCETIDVKTHVCEIPVLYDDLGIKVDCRHNFRDTKYRSVTYWPEATTRYREYFKDDFDKHPDRYKVKGPEVKLEILSTARPDAPKVRYIVPTFDWITEASEGEIKRKRLGGGLRVYLERPWFSSGAGELLGVVLCSSQEMDQCSPLQRLASSISRVVAGNSQNKGRLRAILDISDTDDPDAGNKPLITQWGADSLWNTPSLPELPGKDHFKSFRDFRRGLSLEEAAGPQRGSTNAKPSSQGSPDNRCRQNFSVVAYDVHFDPDRNLWYSDILMDSRLSYFPFVRLSLARYQPNSLFTEDGSDCSLSRVVLNDFVQLFPDRWASLSYESKEKDVVTVTVYGVAPIPIAAGRNKSTSEPTNQVFVSIQQRCPSFHGHKDEVQWFPLEPYTLPIRLELRITEDGVSVWSSKIVLPSHREKGQFRFVIEEFESHLTDSAIRSLKDTPLRKHRLVYSDEIMV
jgi:hypothetical protein